MICFLIYYNFFFLIYKIRFRFHFKILSCSVHYSVFKTKLLPLNFQLNTYYDVGAFCNITMFGEFSAANNVHGN